jgi:PAS domain S-box-containing protein
MVRFPRLLGVLILAWCVMVASAGSIFASDAQPVRVVMDNNYPPFVFQDGDGRLQGILVDQWRLWERKTGRKAELHAMDWNEALRRMQAGEFDVIDTIFLTENRARQYDYLPAYQKIEVPIYFDREISGIVDASSLTGFAVGVKKGDAAIEFLTRQGIDSLLLYDSYKAILEAARDRKITVFVVDAPPARYFLHKFGMQGRFRQTEPLYVGEFHRAVRKGDREMFDLVKGGFEAMSAQELREIEQKWYGKPVAPFVEPRQVLLGLGVIVLVVSGLVVWNWSLRRAAAQRTAALESSERRNRTIVEALPDMLFRISSDGRFLDCQAADHESLLMPLAQFVGKNVSEVLPPDIAEMTMKHLDSALRTGALQQYEYRLTIGGAERFYESRMVRGGDQEALAVVRDVTDRKKAEADLLKKTNELNTFFNASLDLFCIADMAGNFIRLNTEWEITLGYSLAELEGHRFLDFVHPEDLGPTLEAVQTLASQTQVLNFVNRYRCKDGSYRWIEWRSLPAGNLIYAAARDITERKRVEETLRANEEKYRQLFEAESDAIFLIENESGAIVEVNSAAEALYGYGREELLRMKNTDLSAEPGETRRRTDQALQGEKDIIAIPFRLHRKKDGTVFPVDITARSFLLHGKSVHIAAIRDISERKRLEEQLFQSQKMEAVGILAGGVAHDFNNILQSVISSAYLLKLRHEGDADIRRIADDILALSDRAADLTRGLLAFSRKQFISPQTLDLNEVITSGTRMFQRLIGEDVHLVTELCPERLYVSADSTQIQQVLLNLMNNARDAMPTGGTVTVRSYQAVCDLPDDAGTCRTVACAVLEVCDTGTGIAGKDLPHIFEPFFTTKEVGKGTGLGLSVAYGIVAQHRGAITVSSEPGNGAVFRVMLPLLPPTEARQETPQKLRPAREGRGERLLLIEDDESVRATTRQFLIASGYDVVALARGAEAIEYVREHPGRIRLALIDVIMPEMNGAEVCRMLQAVQPELKVIFMSGYPKKVLEERQLPDMPCLQKPVLPGELLRAVREALAEG